MIVHHGSLEGAMNVPVCFLRYLKPILWAGLVLGFVLLTRYLFCVVLMVRVQVYFGHSFVYSQHIFAWSFWSISGQPFFNSLCLSRKTV